MFLDVSGSCRVNRVVKGVRRRKGSKANRSAEENLVVEKIYREKVSMYIKDITSSSAEGASDKFCCMVLDGDQFVGDGN